MSVASDVSGVWRGVVTRVSGGRPYVEITRLAAGFEFGPVEAAVPIYNLTVGTRVLVGFVEGRSHDPIILCRLDQSATLPDFSVAHRYALRAHRVAAQAVGAAVANVTLVFDTVDHVDVAAQYNAATGVYTCAEAGLYHVDARSGPDNINLGRVILALQKNGAGYSRGFDGATTGGYGSVAASAVIPCAVGDLLSVLYSNITGAAHNLQVGGLDLTYLDIFRLGPLV